MREIILATEWYNVKLEYLGHGVVLQTSTALDVTPYDQQIKPHYFPTAETAKAWIIEQAYALLHVGYAVTN